MANLYFKPGGNNYWSTASNWYKDVGYSSANGQIPQTGDIVQAYTLSAPSINSTVSNNSTCNITVTIASGGTISNGTWAGGFTLNSVGVISGGTFTTTTGGISGGTVSGGTFSNTITLSSGTISGGTFTNTVTVSGGTISAGEFLNGSSSVILSSGSPSITGGTYIKLAFGGGTPSVSGGKTTAISGSSVSLTGMYIIVGSAFVTPNGNTITPPGGSILPATISGSLSFINIIPSALTIGTITGSTIALSWVAMTAISGTPYYRVYRSLHGANTWTALGSGTQTTRTYTDTPPNQNVYDYYVSCIDGSGTGYSVNSTIASAGTIISPITEVVSTTGSQMNGSGFLD